MTRHPRRDLSLQRLYRLVRVSLGPGPENSRDARQRITGEFQRGKGIVDGRGLAVAGDRNDAFCDAILEFLRAVETA